ncbi:MAG: hypothetical protein ABEJ43_10240 [Haloferacaceae archaeon]
MGTAQYIPFMAPGHYVRNALVAVSYVTIMLPFMWLIFPVMVWYDMDDITTPLSVVPGIEKGGGGLSAAVALSYIGTLYVVVLVGLPGPP